MRILAFFICTNLNSIMDLFRANNTVANFWMLFATLSAYVAVALEVGPEVDREALAHVACAQIFLFEELFRLEFRFRFNCFLITCFRIEPLLKSTQPNAKMALVSLVICLLI